MKKFTIAATVMALAISTPAMAEDNFAGAKANAIVGYDSIGGGGASFDGVVFGAALGYDLQSDGLVYGVEAELTESSVKAGGVKASRDIYAGGRLGHTIGEDALFYVKAGYSNARASAFGSGINLDGIRAGAGIEYNVSDSMFVRGEYRYSNYELGLHRHQGVVSLGVKF